MKYKSTLNVVPSPDIFGEVNFHILNTCFPKLFHFKIEGVFIFWWKEIK